MNKFARYTNCLRFRILLQIHTIVPNLRQIKAKLNYPMRPKITRLAFITAPSFEHSPFHPLMADIIWLLLILTSYLLYSWEKTENGTCSHLHHHQKNANSSLSMSFVHYSSMNDVSFGELRIYYYPIVLTTSSYAFIVTNNHPNKRHQLIFYNIALANFSKEVNYISFIPLFS